MLCPKCGTELPDNAKFCLSCGEKLTNYKKNEINYNENDINKKSTETKANSESTSQNNATKKSAYVATTKQPIFKSNTPPKETHYGCLVLIAIFVGICIAIGSCSHNNTVKKEKKIAAEYEKGLNELRIGNYDEASVSLVEFSTNRGKPIYKYKDGDIMYNIASAMEQYYGKRDYEMALQYLKDVPDSYFSGEFGDKLTEIKENAPQKSKQQQAKEKAQKEAEAKEYNSKLHVGDPENKIEDVMGTPESVNRTVSGSHEFKQYVYKNSSVFIYTEDGIITGFQD